MDIQILLAQVEATDAFGELAPPMQIAILLGALSFATAALVSLTAFTRIIIVLSFVRRALSTTEIPPNQVMLGLSFFLTLFVMAPTLEAINTRGVQPYLAAQQSEGTTPEFGVTELVTVSTEEIRRFMTVHTRGNDLQLFVDLANLPETTVAEETPLKVLIPAFIISELKTAFIMGFCIYIPFLLIDLVISTILMSLGMMMMPPVIVSTPCKLLLFVLVDGWQLISKALVSSFVI
ncbi:MAG: flagellar type III secretion system pore protein FliP [Mariniblastus sp.]|jgi:flagellar biosynthesis protein FliP|nr:flagellar type III secretion system pore protein FliP [Mariniblastus sp.]MDG2182901.1 flagellar type III secretion system pore protein FliP [Mariniblastus sp.]